MRIIPSVISPRRRVRGPGLHGVVGRVPSRGGTCDVIYSLLAWVAAAAVLTSCGKPGSDSPDGKSPDRAVSAAKAGATDAVEIVTPSGVEMVYVPGGEFKMGSNQGHPDEAPAHPVKVSGFLMDKFEVTHEMFAKAQMPNPSHWQDNPKKPVERVRWRDAKQYCNERSLLEGLKSCYNEKTTDWDCDYAANGYRLPTEAEWEYACRAGAPEPTAEQLAKCAVTFAEKTQPVGTKSPNAWGLHDMLGNVAEWCVDLKGKPVVCGGSFEDTPKNVKASARKYQTEGWQANDPQDPKSKWWLSDGEFVGFRVIRVK